MTSVSHFRGHLFADLRGYTAFIEKAGNAAGADLVRRFRQLVRDEVGEHSGAEVKTEGDAIYVVFPSASTAVMCGLALIEKAARATAENPALPITMGIGVHAGEAVEVPEGGYIGSAVNLAARVCAIAEPGEVWVTGTVRGIAQASAPVSFVSKGRRRLKGIAEPVELYRVLPAGAALPAQRRIDRRLALGGAGVLGVGAVVALALVFWAGGSPSATPSIAAEPTSQTLRIGALDIAEYASDAFTPPFTIAVTDPGWTLTAQRAASTDFFHEASPAGKMAVARLTGIASDPCNPDGAYPIDVGDSPEDLVAALRETTYLEVGVESPIQIDRKPGLQVDATISSGVFAACDIQGEVPVFPLGSQAFGAAPGDRIRVESIMVDGQAVTFLMVTPNSAGGPVPEIENFFVLGQNLIDSVRF